MKNRLLPTTASASERGYRTRAFPLKIMRKKPKHAMLFWPVRLHATPSTNSDSYDHLFPPSLSSSPSHSPSQPIPPSALHPFPPPPSLSSSLPTFTILLSTNFISSPSTPMSFTSFASGAHLHHPHLYPLSLPTHVLPLPHSRHSLHLHHLHLYLLTPLSSLTPGTPNTSIYKIKFPSSLLTSLSPLPLHLRPPPLTSGTLNRPAQNNRHTEK